MTDKKVFKFGLKKSVLSESDKVCMFKYEQVDLPSEFSLNDFHELHIFHQGQCNSCSANAISNQIILSTSKEELKDQIPGRMYIYFNSRLTDQTLHGSNWPKIGPLWVQNGPKIFPSVWLVRSFFFQSLVF